MFPKPSYRVLALSAVLLAPITMTAQIDRAELNGTITDSSGAAVSHASVTITQEGTNQTRQTVTNAHGQYVVSSLPIGRFTVVFQGAGFQDLRVADLDLHSGDIRTVNGTMQIGTVSEVVSVEADRDGAQLNKSDATLGDTIQSVQVSRLPLNGRNLTNLELLAPGAIDSGSGAQSSIRFAGNGTDDNNFRLDGVDASGIFHASLKSALRLQFSTEAVAEFKVDSGGYGADTGGSAGAQVSLISKTGTDAFHGSVFDYFRNNYFDAAGPFKSSTKRPVFQLNQYGASIGGPIIKDRTFFFINYEGFQQHLGGVPQTGLVPSPAFRATVAAAQPSLAPIVNAYPAGMAPTSDPNVYTYIGVVPSPNSENAGTIRIDHRFTGNDSAYARYNIDDGASTSALNALSQAVSVKSRLQNFVLEESHVISPRAINEVQFGFNRNVYIQSQKTGLPFNFSITGLTSLNENYSKEQVGQSESVNETVTWTKANHTLKFGAEVEFILFNEQNSVDGTASFLSLSAFQANQLNTFQTTAALPDKGMHKTHVAGYAQDQWKATRALTVSYGLRYNYFSPFHEVHNSAIAFDIAECGGYCSFGGLFYHPNYLSFDPRASIAYSPDALKGNTVFRAGFGVYHGEVQLGDEDSPAVNNEPSTLLTSGVQSNGTFVQYSYPVDPALTPSTGLALTPRSMALHHPDSYVEQWTASVQQAFPGQTALTMTYLGSHGVHLFRRSYTNLIDPATNKRPLPQFPSQIDTKYNQGMSTFNAVVVSLSRRFHNGLFFGSHYMYSHALNDGSVGAGDGDAAQNLSCFRCEYASSDFDARNSGNVSAVYDLPFGRGRTYLNNASKAMDLLVGGWSINTLYFARAGFPINVTLSRPASELPDGNNQSQRPNRIAGVPLYLPNRSTTQWINPAAFALPAIGTWGTAGRNIANGPALWQNDTAIEKSFHATEKSNILFRAEAFNMFNRAQYASPSAALSVVTTGGVRTLSVPKSFGLITSPVNSAGLVGSGTPRVLEFSLRLNY
ncbi:TonB-dependent receptor [Terriglobus roseus]|uniref:Carboxypeptidase regulatory-like domain-containing protein n=1 Tax=Terriglobus roseus TaxID=392734 RepID=A0A1G7KRA8_9BACT|nr:carboxypeptidase regulatory-like domain-containing protein [Terriglobus roseus]SDF39743.1 Carboxypeptidase regulatory-like domain-containing protein [Terriglobus roseus]